MVTSFGRAILGDSGRLAVANGLGAVLGALYVGVIARRLGPAEYGTVAMGLAINSFLALLVGPLETSLAKAVADHQGSPGHLGTLLDRALRRSIPLLSGLACGLFVVLWGSADRLDIGGVQGAAILTLYAVASALCALPRAVLRGDTRFTAYGFNQVAEAAARLGIGIALAAVWPYAVGALAGYTAGIIFAALLGFYQLRGALRSRREPAELGSLRAASSSLFVVYLYSLILLNWDVLVAKYALTADDAGLYGAATSLARMLYLGGTPLHLVLFSRIAAQRARGESTRAEVRRILVLLAASLLIGILVAAFFGKYMLVLLFGTRFLPAADLLVVLWTTTSVIIFQNTVLLVLVAQNRLRGIGAFLVPCVVYGGLLLRWHATSLEIAGAGLIASLTGFGAVLWMIRRSGRGTAT